MAGGGDNAQETNVLTQVLRFICIGTECSWVKEHLPTTYKALGPIPSTAKKYLLHRVKQNT
jgi:hypothetical protein